MLVSVIPGADAPAVVGEMEMLNGQPRMASVTATTRVKVQHPPFPRARLSQPMGRIVALGEDSDWAFCGCLVSLI